VVTTRPAAIRTVLSNSSAFGGTNVSLVLAGPAPADGVEAPTSEDPGLGEARVEAAPAPVGAAPQADGVEAPTSEDPGLGRSGAREGGAVEGGTSGEVSGTAKAVHASSPGAGASSVAVGAISHAVLGARTAPAGSTSPVGRAASARGTTVGRGIWLHGAGEADAGARGRGRGGDRLSELLSAAVGAALAEAGVGRSADRDRIGMLIGVADGPQQSMRAFVDSRDARGLAGASAQAFSRMVLNAATGAASLAHQLRGPSLTLWSGEGAGLQAIFGAAVWLEGRPDLWRILAGAADEVGHVTAVRRRVLGEVDGGDVEAAAVVALGRDPGPVRLDGRAIGGPAELAAVLRRAAPDRPDRVVLWAGVDHAGAADVARAVWPGVEVVAPLGGMAASAASACGVVRAAQWLRGGEAGRVVTASVSRESGSVAMAWSASGERPAPRGEGP
jgi:hypothetical protein